MIAPPTIGNRVFRIVFGLFWITSGIAGLCGLVPPPSTSAAGMFLRGLEATGYLLPLMCLVQMLAGTLILSPRLVPLGLTVLAPVMFQVLAFRVFLGMPRLLPFAVVPLIGHLYLAWVYRAAFAPLLVWSQPARPVAS